MTNYLIVIKIGATILLTAKATLSDAQWSDLNSFFAGTNGAILLTPITE